MNDKHTISNLPIVLPDLTTNELHIYHGNQDVPWTIILPAMGIRASYYHQIAKKLSEHIRQTIVTIDYRGFGYSSVRASRKTDFGFKTWLDDLDFITEIVLKKSGQTGINILGHSIGGQLGALYYSRFPQKVERLFLVGSSLPYYKIWNWPGKLKLWLGGYLAPFFSNIVGYFPGEIIGFAGKEAKSCIADWSHVVRTGKYLLSNDLFDYEQAMKTIYPKITAISFPDDNLAPPYTIPYLLDKFNSSPDIESRIVDGFDHFNWVKLADKFIEKTQIFKT
jgi:predicted alpha/beta hydrolase